MTEKLEKALEEAETQIKKEHMDDLLCFLDISGVFMVYDDEDREKRFKLEVLVNDITKGFDNPTENDKSKILGLAEKFEKSAAKLRKRFSGGATT